MVKTAKAQDILGNPMRALNISEIDQFVVSLAPFVGSELQVCVVGSSGVGIGFWTNRQELSWLWFENNHWFPLVLPLNQIPERSIRPARPLELFMTAHFIGAKLQSITREKTSGRTLCLSFTKDNEDLRVEIRLWPTGGNFIALHAGKRVSLSRVQEIPEFQQNEDKLDRIEPRGFDELLVEWENLRSLRKQKESDESNKARAKKEPDPEELRKKQIARIERALQKVSGDLQSKLELPWRVLGKKLVEQQQFLDEPEMAPFMDRRRSLAWNIENCFSQAKELEKKIELTKKRQSEMLKELEWWKAAEIKDLLSQQPPKAPKRTKAPKAGIRYRGIELDPKHIAKIGKSAQDNIALLRSSQPWDYWLHLRDFPGSHAILPRQKSEKIPESFFRQVGLALIENSKGNKKSSWIGVKVDIIVVECRFVRPIRGDKLGRVNYTNERTLTIRI